VNLLFAALYLSAAASDGRSLAEHIFGFLIFGLVSYIAIIETWRDYLRLKLIWIEQRRKVKAKRRLGI
jgi:hypothetical protein